MVTRRSFLYSLGAGVAAACAGCQSSGMEDLTGIPRYVGLDEWDAGDLLSTEESRHTYRLYTDLNSDEPEKYWVVDNEERDMTAALKESNKLGSINDNPLQIPEAPYESRIDVKGRKRNWERLGHRSVGTEYEIIEVDEFEILE